MDVYSACRVKLSNVLHPAIDQKKVIYICSRNNDHKYTMLLAKKNKTKEKQQLYNADKKSDFVTISTADCVVLFKVHISLYSTESN